MADEANVTAPELVRSELEAERDRIDTLLRRLDDPEERRHRDAARLIAIAIIYARLGRGVPMPVVEAIRKRDPDGVGRFFGNLACEADGWTTGPDRQGNGLFLWIPKTAADALAWPKAVPDDQADAKKPEEPGQS